MRYHSIFDVLGHVMVGPSSSHTAGACRIAYAARLLFGRTPRNAKIGLICWMELDSRAPDELLNELASIPGIISVRLIDV